MTMLAKIKADIICSRHRTVYGKVCGSCGYVRAMGPELRCRNPKSMKADQIVDMERDKCGLWVKDQTAGTFP